MLWRPIDEGTLQVQNRPNILTRIDIAKNLSVYMLLLTNKLPLTHSFIADLDEIFYQ